MWVPLQKTCQQLVGWSLTWSPNLWLFSSEPILNYFTDSESLRLISAILIECCREKEFGEDLLNQASLLLS